MSTAVRPFATMAAPPEMPHSNRDGSVTGFVETYRGCVHAWECDHYGHLNVQFYIGRISDAFGTLMGLIDMGGDAVARRNLGLVAVHQENEFRRELRAGALVVVQSGIAGIGGKKIRLHHRLYNGESGELAFEARVLCICMDLTARRAAPLPEDVVALAGPYLVDEQEAPESRVDHTVGVMATGETGA